MKISRTTYLLLCVVLVVGLIAGCSKQKQEETTYTPEHRESNKPAKQDQSPANEKSPTDELSPEAPAQFDSADETINGITNPMRWLSYSMSIDVAEENPPGSSTAPAGRFVHIIMTYLSDDDSNGGFLFEDLMGKIDITLTDT